MTARKTIFSLFLFSLPLLGLAEKPSQQKTVTFAAYDSPPWYIHSDTGPATGVIPHYTQQLSAQTEYSVVMKPMPYQRIITSTSDKNIDFVVSVEHPDLFKSAYPYMKLGKLSSVVYSTKPLEDLLVSNNHKPKVGVLRGVVPLVHKLTPKELIDKWNIIEFNSEESGFRSAQIGRLDAAILTRNVYEYLVDEAGGNNPGYIEELGFFDVFAWLPKRIKLNYELIKMRKKIEEITYGGKIVLDWRTALNRFQESEQSPAVDNQKNTELRQLLRKISKH